MLKVTKVGTDSSVAARAGTAAGAAQPHAQAEPSRPVLRCHG